VFAACSKHKGSHQKQGRQSGRIAPKKSDECI
jgi:hypothetical protein